jgi:hypothetical protein
MKHTAVAMALAVLLAAPAAGLFSSDAAEEAAVRHTLELYLQGQATGSAEPMKLAFHPEAHLTVVRNDTVATTPIADYLSRMPGHAAPDEAQRTRRIESVDVTGTAAIGKVVLDYPQVRFVDYMSLLKVGGEWRIIHKSYYMERK